MYFNLNLHMCSLFICHHWNSLYRTLSYDSASSDGSNKPEHQCGLIGAFLVITPSLRALNFQILYNIGSMWQAYQRGFPSCVWLRLFLMALNVCCCLRYRRSLNLLSGRYIWAWSEKELRSWNICHWKGEHSSFPLLLEPILIYACSQFLA